MGPTRLIRSYIVALAPEPKTLPGEGNTAQIHDVLVQSFYSNAGLVRLGTKEALTVELMPGDAARIPSERVERIAVAGAAGDRVGVTIFSER